MLVSVLMVTSRTLAPMHSATAQIYFAFFGGNAPQQLASRAFSGVAPDFFIIYGRHTTGFTFPRWQGYPTFEEPLEAMPLKVQATSAGMSLHWSIGGAASYNVYHSENLRDWTLITESLQPSVGALAIFEDTDPSRLALAKGYYRVEP